jgi:hypothetical protein
MLAYPVSPFNRMRRDLRRQAMQIRGSNVMESFKTTFLLI